MKQNEDCSIFSSPRACIGTEVKRHKTVFICYPVIRSLRLQGALRTPFPTHIPLSFYFSLPLSMPVSCLTLFFTVTVIISVLFQFIFHCQCQCLCPIQLYSSVSLSSSLSCSTLFFTASVNSCVPFNFIPSCGCHCHHLSPIQLYFSLLLQCLCPIQIYFRLSWSLSRSTLFLTATPNAYVLFKFISECHCLYPIQLCFSLLLQCLCPIQIYFRMSPFLSHSTLWGVKLIGDG